MTRSPIAPVPASVLTRARRLRRVRILDWITAWLAAWGASLQLDGGDPAALAVVAALLVGAASAVPLLRRRWRPAAAVAAFLLSLRLRVGDRAWLVTSDGAVPVLVTACRPFRVVIAGAGGDPLEGVAVRRTRALLLSA